MSWSLRSQLLGALGVLTAILVLILGALAEEREGSRLRAKAKSQHEDTLFFLGSTLTDAIVAEDSALMTELLERFGTRDKSVLVISMEDSAGRELSRWEREETVGTLRADELIHEVLFDGDLLGRIRLQLDQQYLVAEVRDRVLEVRAALLVALVVVGLFIALLIYHIAISPLSRIDRQVRLLQEKDPPKPMNLGGAKEFVNVGAAIDAFGKAIQEQRLADEEHKAELELLNGAYRRFVPQQFLNYLNRESIIQVERGDQVARDMTILFSDIRSFTTFSEEVGSQETFDFINDFLRGLGPVIRENGGFIDKYIGDAIMALFDSPCDALRAANGLMEALEEFNLKREASGDYPIEIGIGINTGPLMLGIIGEEERLEGTVIGDVVNLAARLEALTKKYKVPVLFSSTTFKRMLASSQSRSLGLPVDLSDFRYVDEVRAKGRAGLTPIYEHFGWCNQEVRTRRHALAQWRESELLKAEHLRADPTESSLKEDPLWPVFRAEVLGRETQSSRTPQSRLNDVDEELLWS
jgi:class 3 adenylate cyclase